MTAVAENKRRVLAVAATLIVRVTVAPVDGDVIETAGAVVSLTVTGALVASRLNVLFG